MRVSVRFATFNGALCGALLTGAIRTAVQVPAVTPQEVSAAVHDGLSRHVDPYPLKHSADSRTTVGVVFTPHIRIARHVWQARERGEAIDTASVPDELLEPVAYVALQAPAGGSDESAAHNKAVMAAILRPPTAGKPGESIYFVPVARRLVPPSREVGLGAARALLGEIPVERVGLVGVFPLDAVRRAVVEFAAYRLSDGTYHVAAGYAVGPLQ
jgi:hypothetical protein